MYVDLVSLWEKTDSINAARMFTHPTREFIGKTVFVLL